MEIPDNMCGCSSESLRVSPGKTVAVITMNGKGVKIKMLYSHKFGTGLYVKSTYDF